ncbi:MAG: branched-chain amino acid ABC transporter permease [Ruminococcaceae bacterium]|nr:branched-chain amino acid ABC transporter permease [Oscillospiraceae bacterium]
MSFLETLINGISLGSVYAIIALGYTMVYGIAKMLNFAHGDVIMVGGFACFFMTSSSALDLHPALGVLVAVVVCTALGILIERMAYKPLRQAPSLAVLITAIGVSYFLQNGMLLLLMKALKRSQKVSFPKLFGDKSFNFGEITISVTTIVTIAACVVIMLALTWFTSRTKMGKAMRACSEDKAAAQLMGINVNTTISVTFAIGSALAAIAGVLMCTAYPNLEPTTGAMPGIKAFTAAVFGGIGSIPGALLGGVLLGVIEIVAKSSPLDALADAIVFAVLIIVLLVKPTGLLGKKIREKV